MNKTYKLLTLAAISGVSYINAASIQVGDLRLPSANYNGGYTYFDAASGGDLTRAVSGAPVGVNSTFTAVTQNSGDTLDPSTDIGLQTYSSATVIRQLNRFGSDPDGPAGAAGPQRAGGVQWQIGLSPIDGYLSGNSLDLTTLDLRLLTDPSDDNKSYDVYLSYTLPADSISILGLDTSDSAGTNNYNNVWLPAQSGTEGDIINGTHKLIELNFTGNMDTTINLLPLYDAGVSDVNLIMMSGAFFSGRTIGINDGSGLFIDTVAIPEPSSAILMGLGSVAFLLRRRR